MGIIKGFSGIRIFSNNISGSRDWYKSLFNQEPIINAELFVVFKVADTFFEITTPDYKNPFSQGGCVGYWLVDDIESLIIRAIELGGKIHRGPLKISEAKKTIVQIEDSFGNIIGFEAPEKQNTN